MALIPSLTRPSPAQPKGTKTKAKQRYLKAKKNRNKSKGKGGGQNQPASTATAAAAAAGRTSSKKSRTSERHESEDESESSNSEDEDDSATEDEVLEPVSSSSSSKKVINEQLQSSPSSSSKIPPPSERPKKKRKLDLETVDSTVTLPEANNASASTSTPSVSSQNPNIESEDIIVDDPSPQEEAAAAPLPALPRFPLPIQPEAPSASVLYLQGVDQALIEAEVIDPARTLAISSSTSATTEGGGKRRDGTAEIDSDTSGLSLKTRQRLAQLGITELFAVQTAILPFLLPPPRTSTGTRSGLGSGPSLSRALYLPYNTPRDLCVSAPTGSGKTLAYVLPIIEVLSTRVVTRLRALVVLPTRDLVAQVRETLEALCKGRDLKIGSATGQHPFAHEQAQLVGESLSLTRLEGGRSKVDILVCTPGRLMDHLQGTPNFTLQHLRFLVIDEADRLVTEAFQDWLAQVMDATRPHPTSSTSSASTSPPTAQHDSTAPSFHIPFPDALHPAWLRTSSTTTTTTDLSLCLRDKPRGSCQKLLFSATLTRDPSKIAALNLHEPKYFVVGDGGGAVGMAENEDGSVGESFAFPATLQEHFLICDGAVKPLMLLYLMHTRGVTNALVFTKSAESTARLVKLIQAFEKSLSPSSSSMDMDVDKNQNASGAIIDKTAIIAEAYSSDLTGPQRKTILDKFRNAEIGILVCSDLIARGIDISHVSHVVSYDAPVDMRKYVHRVGRTARAGRHGEAWSLVEEQEGRYFKKMMNEAGHLDRLAKFKVPPSKALEPFTTHYEYALGKLKETYGR